MSTRRESAGVTVFQESSSLGGGPRAARKRPAGEEIEREGGAPALRRRKLQEKRDKEVNDRLVRELGLRSSLIEDLGTHIFDREDRQKLEKEKVQRLGGKAAKGVKIPTNILLGMRKKQRWRQDKKEQELREMGMAPLSKKPKPGQRTKEAFEKEKRKEHSKHALGRESAGSLSLSREDIARITGGGRGGGGSHRGRGGGGRGGGGKASSRGKSKGKKKRIRR